MCVGGGVEGGGGVSVCVYELILMIFLLEYLRYVLLASSHLKDGGCMTTVTVCMYYYGLQTKHHFQE